MGVVQGPTDKWQGAPAELQNKDEPPSGGGMEARVAKLEAAVEHIQSDIKDLKSDVREMRKDAREDFRILFGAIIVASLGLAGLLARGFHWF